MHFLWSFRLKSRRWLEYFLKKQIFSAVLRMVCFSCARVRSFFLYSWFGRLVPKFYKWLPVTVWRAKIFEIFVRILLLTCRVVVSRLWSVAAEYRLPTDELGLSGWIEQYRLQRNPTTIPSVCVLVFSQVTTLVLCDFQIKLALELARSTQFLGFLAVWCRNTKF